MPDTQAIPVGFCSIQNFQQEIEKKDSPKNKGDKEQYSCFFFILGVRYVFNLGPVFMGVVDPR